MALILLDHLITPLVRSVGEGAVQGARVVTASTHGRKHQRLSAVQAKGQLRRWQAQIGAGHAKLQT